MNNSTRERYVKEIRFIQSNVTIIQPENIYTTGIRLWKQSNRHFKVKATTQTNALECMHWLLERLQKNFTFLPDHFITRIIFLFHKQNQRWQWWWRFGRITSPLDSVQVGKALKDYKGLDGWRELHFRTKLILQQWVYLLQGHPTWLRRHLQRTKSVWGRLASAFSRIFTTMCILSDTFTVQ